MKELIKGAVFDMDGLMFDTERLVYQNWLEAMTSRGYEYNIEIFKRTIGKRKAETELIYKELYGEDFPYWELADGCRNRFYGHVKAQGVPVKKGLYEILKFFSQKGVKIALATSTSKQTAVMNLKSADAYGYFDALICGDDVVNGKPNPEVFLTAAERLGLAAEECVAFEDSINGIISASSAGMVTVMVPDFLEPTEEILPLINFLCADLLKAKNALNEKYF